MIHRISILLAFLVASSTLAQPTTRPARTLDPAAQRAADAARARLDKTNAARGPEFTLDIGRPRRVEASMACVIAAPRMTPTEWVIIGALPPNLPQQKLIEHTSTPEATPVEDLSPLKRPCLRWRVPANDSAKALTTIGFTFHLDLLPRNLRPRNRSTPPPQIAPLSKIEQQAFTAPGPLTDFDAPAFQSFLSDSALRPTATETDIDFARRAFLFIRSKAQFAFNPNLDRRASAVCKSVKSDCGGLTALFVSILRAGGIPARQMIGRWATSAKPADKLDGQDWQQEHIKAEFFAAGIGWVPVDMSVAVEFDKPGDLKRFGRDDGDFIVFHIDPDLQIDTLHFGHKTQQLLQEPVFWITGQGTTENATIKSDWQVKRRQR